MGDYQANINVANLDKNRMKNEVATRYVFKKMRDFCVGHNIRLLIVMDGVREAVYHQNDKIRQETLNKPLSLNAMAKSISSEYNIDFIDLHKIFETDFCKNQKKFNFNCNMHWNEYGHKVAAGR